MQRTISVTGFSKLSIKPDETIIKFNIVNLNIEYPKALENSFNNANIVINSLVEIGFSKEDIKTENFKVEPKYEGFYDDKHIYHKQFIGYECSQTLYLSFASSNHLLGRILNNISRLEVNPEVYINYSVQDIRKIKNSLLKLAFDDATTKAMILANSAKVSLDSIVKIEHSNNFYPLLSQDYQFFQPQVISSEVKSSISPNITPKDIEIEESVLVVWSLI